MAKKPINIDPAQILVFPFQEQAWLKKFLIASLLVFFSFIPVIPIVLLLGYAAEIIRRIAVDHESPSLPEWDDFSAYFNEGFRLFGVGAVYLIPATLMIVIGYVGMFIPVFLVESGVMSESEAFGLMIAGFLAGFGMMGIGTLVSMLTGLILPIAGTHVVVSGDFKSAFKFKELWALFRANWAGFIIVYLILIGAAVILYYGAYFLVATVVLCCLYPFALSFMSAYLLLVGAGFFANAYRIAGENIPKKAE